MKPIKRAIALCWIMLVACFAIKLFGGNWFEVVCTNEHFIKVCNFIDEKFLLHQVSSYFIYVIPTFFILLSCCQVPKPSKTQLVVLICSLSLVWASKFIDIQLKTILEVVNTLFMPIVLRMCEKEKFKETMKSRWFYGIIGYFLVLLFQLLSLFAKNIGIHFVSESLFVTFILLIDYYIMIALYYLYTKLRKENRNG